MDRPGREQFELIGEVEDVLGIGVYPVTWPAYDSSHRFRGVYHRERKEVHLFDAARATSSAAMGSEIANATITKLDDPKLKEELGDGFTRLKEEVQLLDEAATHSTRRASNQATCNRCSSGAPSTTSASKHFSTPSARRCR